MNIILVATPSMKGGPTLWWTGAGWSESKDDAAVYGTQFVDVAKHMAGLVPEGYHLMGMPMGTAEPSAMRDIGGLEYLKLSLARPVSVSNKADLVGVPPVPVSNHLRMLKHSMPCEYTQELPPRATGAKHWAPGSKGVDVTGKTPPKDGETEKA